MSVPDLSALAHELKTPLAVISGFSELLAARDDERTRVEAAQQIQEASDRLAKAVDDLLEILVEDEELARNVLAARLARGLPE